MYSSSALFTREQTINRSSGNVQMFVCVQVHITISRTSYVYDRMCVFSGELGVETRSVDCNRAMLFETMGRQATPSSNIINVLALIHARQVNCSIFHTWWQFCTRLAHSHTHTQKHICHTPFLLNWVQPVTLTCCRALRIH